MKKNRRVYTLLCGAIILFILVALNQPSTCVFGEGFNTVIDPDLYSGSNDFEKLQNALDDVPSTGATILVPSKIYEGSGLRVPSNVRIVGTNGAVFRLSDSATDPLIVIDNKMNVVIEDIMFDGNKDNNLKDQNMLICIGQGCEDVSIFNNTFADFRFMGIGTNCSDGNATRYVTIHHNMFCNGDGAAVVLKGSYPNGRFLWEDLSVYENVLCNLTANGKIGVAFASHVDVVHNQLSSCEASQSGNIVIRGCRDVQIFGNSILDSWAIAAIYIETSLVFPNEGIFTIQGNRVMGEVGHGFSMTSSSGVEAEIFVRGNYFTENSGTDIEIPAVNAYVCANYVDTSSDLSFSGPIVAWGNRFLSNLPCYAFILKHSR